jgi:hypothetical protein
MSLIRAGAKVIPAVASAAETDDLETAARCIEILTSFHNGGNEAAKQAAEEALKKLAQSSHTSVAQRAAETIKPPEPEGPTRTVFINGRPVVVRIQRAAARRVQLRGRPAPQQKQNKAPDADISASLKSTPDGVTLKLTEKSGKQTKVSEFKAKNVAELRKKFPDAYKAYRNQKLQQARNQAAAQGIRINFGAAGGNIQIRNKFQFKRVSRTNGKRQIEVGNQDRTIKITDENGKNIVVEVTEKKGPKSTKSVYKADNLEDLKKKHPAAAKLYEEHAGQAGKAEIRIGF